MKPRRSPSFLCGWRRPSTPRPRSSARRCCRRGSCWRGATMLDRRINKLRQNLLAQADEAPIIRHLVDTTSRSDDLLGEACRAVVLLHPGGSFEQALTLARTIAYIVYIDDYLEEEHPELDLADYRRVCQKFFLLAHRDLSQMPPGNATVTRKIEGEVPGDEGPGGRTAIRPLGLEETDLTMLHEDHLAQ